MGEELGGDAGTTGQSAQVQGNITLQPDQGGHTSFSVGSSPATVDFQQGTPPVAGATFSLRHRPRIPMPPPGPVTPLTPGENDIPFFGSFGNATLWWTCSADGGAATFSWKMAGLPVGPNGWSFVSAPASAQQGEFQIVATAEPATWLLTLSVTAEQKPIVLVYADGNYLASLSDGDNIVVTGRTVALAIDARTGTPELQTVSVAYTLQSQS